MKTKITIESPRRVQDVALYLVTTLPKVIGKFIRRHEGNALVYEVPEEDITITIEETEGDVS